MGTPYYGAYAATAFMAGGTTMSTLDSGSSNYGAYVVFDSAGKPLRALLLNSDYYSGSGTRGTVTFVMSGLSGTTVKAKRLTAASANSRADHEDSISFGGQKFANGTCVIGGTAVYETTTLAGGSGTFVVSASEALVVYLQ